MTTEPDGQNHFSCPYPWLLGALFFVFSLQVPVSTLAATDSELTPQYLGSIESKLSDLRQAGKLDLYDKLIYGKGDFLKVEGKSRRYLVVSLDKSGRYFARLFDLPDSQLKEAPIQRSVYFTGVCSKIELAAGGTIDVTVTYSLLTSTADRVYTMQAQGYAQRVEEARKKNQVLLTKADGAPQSGQAPPQAVRSARTSPANAQSGKPAPASGAVKEPHPTSSLPVPDTKDKGGTGASSGEAGTEEEAEESEGARPHLIQRGSQPKESGPPSSISPAATRTSTMESIQTGGEQDNVVYRRPKPDSTPKEVAGQRAEPIVNRSNVALSPSLQPSREAEGMILIPSGFVTLGSDDPNDPERPVNRVMVEAFYLDQYEVTNLEYKQFCDATGHSFPHNWTEKTFPKEVKKYPVTEVNWQDASAYARWAGKRLPTEAEWERAAKGPNATLYSYGNAYDSGKANTETRKTTSVGSYAPNGFGAYDLTGNVAEWTGSLFKPYPYKASDGREELGTAGPRVVRGGHSSSGIRGSRCLVRTGIPADQPSRTVGFRCARNSR
jgi:formylglycine-generating enzyme required for sulfatase activity